MFDIYFLSPHCDPEANPNEPDSGGQCIYEHQLALSLSALPDFRVTTFCRQNYRRPNETQINPFYKICRIECGPAEFLEKEKIESVLEEFARKVWEFGKEICAGDSLILHSHYWDGGYVGLQLKALAEKKIPFIWTPHSLGILKKRKFPGQENESFYNFLPRQCWEGYTAQFADNMIVSTESEKTTLLDDYAIDSEKIQVIAPGVDIQQFQPSDQTDAREKYGIPQDGKVLLCLGRMVRNKGYHHAINAFFELKKRYILPIYLVIVGGTVNLASAEEKKYHAELRKQVLDLGLEESVLFLSAIEHRNIQEIFSTANIFLMPSEYEPFGLVTVEAMAIGLPVIATNKGGSVNILRHNQTGILTDFHQTRLVASYMLSLLKDEDFALELSAAAQRYARRTYDWYQKSNQFAQVYRQVSRHQEVDDFHLVLENNYFLQKHFVEA